MKKYVSIAIVILLVFGVGYFLFKISPQEQQQSQTPQENFDLSQVKPESQPRAISEDDHILGDPSAKNTFISYEDYQCPACAATADMLKQIPSTFPDTKLVFRYFPLTQIHKNAVNAMYAAEAAGAQGKYWEMHDALFKSQNDWSGLADPVDYFAGLAKNIGVADLDKFKTDITDKKFKSRVEKDLVDSYSLNIPGTPSVFFNGHPIKLDTLDNMKKEAEQYFIK